jgi:hypothetical protein
MLALSRKYPRPVRVFVEVPLCGRDPQLLLGTFAPGFTQRGFEILWCSANALTAGA